ncbi:hypothetical protein [Saccharothrix coeruleofusca]|uniref:Small secreted protein n=1 Tax=Saccharothrix coeruleofusca TaxID=33919 RepID=A0A918AFQ8_9PSEU|nr:hypothetical protein [Saccharothrix coeruleofusca]MBP2340338.1 hypothetical protein [Saccharothrix coeruleofusca]GGP36091.1 hypothetical protein GCM10010185_03900 [Saccharothrix coeruleofusca]
MGVRLAAALAASALLAGCGSGGDDSSATSSTPPSTSSNDAAVAYVDKVCAAASSFVSVPKTPPKLDATDQNKLKADMAAYMGQMADAFGSTATRLREVGPSPVAGGDEQVEKMAATFTDVAKTFGDARSTIEQADANDPVGGIQAAGDAIARLDEFTEPLKQLESHPELAAAAQQAPSCQALRTLRPSTATSEAPPATS